MINNKIKWRESPNDVFFTPLGAVKIMVDMCDIAPDMKVLDPCRATGNFYNNLPECKKEWCEITEGKDFFDFNERVDLVIGNPPYSLWDKWLDHTAEITDKFCYILGANNLTPKRIRKMEEKGFGLTKLHITQIDWWYSRSFICIFEKNKPSVISYSNTIGCECGVRCLRGRKGNSVNYCSPKPN
jgi:hypothetical protein